MSKLDPLSMTPEQVADLVARTRDNMILAQLRVHKFKPSQPNIDRDRYDRLMKRVFK